MHRKVLAGVRFAIVALGILAGCTSVAAATVEIEVHDTTPFHVFTPDTPFTVDITARLTAGSTPPGLAYQWRNFRGDPMGPAVPLTLDVRTTVNSPSAVPPPGYYGLSFLPRDAGVVFNETTGSRGEIGFAVLAAPAGRALDLQSPFGLVHADLDDPYIATWVKTLTWNTTGASSWAAEMRERREAGLQELPLVNGDGWDGDDTASVPGAFLTALRDKISGYLEADPAITYWELGLEENLRDRFDEPFYFPNLQAKAAAVHEAARALGIEVRPVYNVAGTGLSSQEAFLTSAAAGEFSVFAPHPYAWPDFPAPETWLETSIDGWRGAMQRAGVELPMWFTEVGAPQNDAQVAQMLSGTAPVRGQRRDEHAAYMVRTHALALERGVERLFWYNYRDRGSSTTDVEEHFGLVDNWGFPKPVYPAYVTMHRCLAGKSFKARRDLTGNVRVYEFSDDTQSCLIAWSYPPAPQRVALSALRAGLSVDNVVTLSDTVGTPLPVSADVPIDEFPVFVVSPLDTQRPSAPADLIATAESTGEVTLQWSASVDNMAVTGYNVFRDGAAIAVAPVTGYSDRGLAAGTTYAYEVSAVDAQGNESARSNPATAETAAVNTPGSSANGVLLLLWLSLCAWYRLRTRAETSVQ